MTKCDWCKGPLVKARNGVPTLITANSTNNYICDACWKAYLASAEGGGHGNTP